MTHGRPDDHHNQRHGDEDHARVVVVGGVTPTTIQPDDAAAAGSSTTAAAADHKHAIVADVAGAVQPDDAAAEGTATSFARSDHKHSIVADVAGTSNPNDTAAEGSATSFSRSDHKHARELVRTFAGAANADLTLGTTVADVSAATVTFTTTMANALAVAYADWDIENTTAGTGFSNGYINCSQGGTNDFAGAIEDRVHREWVSWTRVYTLTTPGAFTIKLRGNKNAAGGASAIKINTRIEVLVVG